MPDQSPDHGFDGPNGVRGSQPPGTTLALSIVGHSDDGHSLRPASGRLLWANNSHVLP
jgi:hypothetical protein